MKYKSSPEDFVVEEIAEHRLFNKGSYKLYSLEKKGIETFALLDELSRTHNIPRKELGIAGLKDTHAQTKQYITIPARYDLKSSKLAKITFLGYTDHALKLGYLQGNKFKITVRGIQEHEVPMILENAKTIKKRDT
jgi:tRNA pseudouridine13 synthase